jgi:formylglycine-generating enzyme required for sulfatase activity
VAGGAGQQPQPVKGAGPAGGVTWKKAQEFIRLLNMNENVSKYRLPTEAEWEWACRACGQEQEEGVGDLDGIAWWGKNSGGESHPVGLKRPNALGCTTCRVT